MNNIKEKLLVFEEGFDKIKSKNEKYHFAFIAAYFLISLIFVYIYNKYFTENFTVKIIFFIFIISGLFVHYFLRYKLHKSKNRYKSFFVKLIDELKNDFPDLQELEEDITSSAKEIFVSRKISLDGKNLQYYAFWELLLLNIKGTGQKLK